MSDERVTLHPADSRLSYVEGLLDANDLPSRDVRSKPDCFSIGYVDGTPIGIGGIERYGSDGLLRSVVVESAARGEGLGTALCDALEAEARAAGIDTLYLLTTTARAFFAGRGYEEIERTDPPVTIQETTEFDDLCPSTATCMKKSL
ncbi:MULTISPECIES: arsenic resistance N-acetyltransferase ArsN2 [Haloferax]|uniref:GNAT family N-acetyltransferase n=2 Tax=Haloferax TaxID=2251 RepID=A0A6G1Z2Q2_9EURY|nr:MULTISPECIES: arsenic resistance N-acetyltransferase ArsN2 [Haloferax]KAB1188137.1 GNAT family N-acetyltransferase [Haloferax sp. CBA1149]MRW80812.1 GNAT family N-acetyltransferase [Haloferax marinisediminis]